MAHEELRYDYPRTRHLPWSPGGSKDDLRLAVPEPDGTLTVYLSIQDVFNTRNSLADVLGMAPGDLRVEGC